jgi:hypothetical protein
MLNVIWDDKKFVKDMNNIINYSFGFLDGIQKGEQVFLQKFSQEIIQSMKDFIDSNARVDPQTYHHIYEWYQTGEANARLYKIKYRTERGKINLDYSFSQSQSIQSGSREPFRNKASIMESGTAVTIKPKNSKVLAFMVDNQQVFTSKEVTIKNPGGPLVKHSFEHIINVFFSSYFKQSFMLSSGMFEHLKNPVAFKQNLKRATSGGKALGEQVGYNWIANLGGSHV